MALLVAVISAPHRLSVAPAAVMQPGFYRCSCCQHLAATFLLNQYPSFPAAESPASRAFFLAPFPPLSHRGIIILIALNIALPTT